MGSENDFGRHFTVLVTLRTPEGRQDDVLQLAKGNLPIFARQQGFVSAKVFRSQDTTRILTLLEWLSQADHEACMLSPDWAECDPRFSSLLDRGTIQMDVRTYEPVCIQESVGV